MGLYEFDDDFNWGPIWCDTQPELDEFKIRFKTFGDLRLYIEKHNKDCYEKWRIEREKYLNQCKNFILNYNG